MSLAAYTTDAKLKAQMFAKAQRVMDAAGEPADSIDRLWLDFARAIAGGGTESDLPAMQQVIARFEARDPFHPLLLQMRSTYRRDLYAHDRLDEAMTISEETVRRYRTIVDRPTPSVGAELLQQAQILNRRGDDAGCLERCLAAMSAFDAGGMECDRATGLSAPNLAALCLSRLGRFEEAVALLDAAFERLERCGVEDSIIVYNYFLRRSNAYAGLKRREPAEADFRRAEELMNGFDAGFRAHAQGALEEVRRRIHAIPAGSSSPENP